jgi:predicted nuclease of restriction endonuclease-like (RecB) superfamily
MNDKNLKKETKKNNTKGEILPSEYKSFVEDIKNRIREANYKALKSVNTELIQLYSDIGKIIVEKQDQKGWGKSVVETLAEDLQKEFAGNQGYSSSNLWYMRQFYLTYKDNEKLQPMVGEIGWTHNVIIMQKCKDNLQKEFYIKSTKKFGWTKNVLIHQIESQSYEKYLLNQTNFDKAVPESVKNHAHLAVKDEYCFDFLGLSEEHTEKELETSLMNNIRKFLIEMGGYFTFIGNQYRLEVGGEDFYIDLLLYHRKLKCLIAIELKAGKFKPEHTGQINFYLSVLNDKMKLEDENPAIGIILCREKNRVVVEYALKDTTQPIGVSTYHFTNKLTEELQKYLPTGEEIMNRLEGL